MSVLYLVEQGASVKGENPRKGIGTLVVDILTSPVTSNCEKEENHRKGIGTPHSATSPSPEPCEKRSESSKGGSESLWASWCGSSPYGCERR